METGNEELHSAKEKRFVDEGQKIFKWIPAAAIVAFLLIVVIQVKSCKEERAKDPPPPPAATAPAASTESHIHILENYKDVTPWFRPRKGFRRDWETTGGTAGVCTPNGRCELDDERRYVSVDPNTPIQFESMERNGRVTIKIIYTPN